jgi:hypothetical protein
LERFSAAFSEPWKFPAGIFQGLEIPTRQAMLRAMRSVFVSAVCLLLAGVAGAATPTNAPAGVVTTRNFRVTGLDPGANSVIASYAESALASSAQLTGLAVRHELFPPIRIELAANTHNPAQRVTRSQQMRDGILDQRLHVLNPSRADTEDFLEALCWLTLNRLAVQLQTRLTMPPPPQVPEWLAVGLAQNLFPQYPKRNRQVALRRWQADKATRFADITTWRLLPEGRWADKALCGEAVEFLLTAPDRPGLFSALLARAMAKQPLDAAWFAKQLGAADTRALEKQWDVWVLHWNDAVPSFGALTREQTDALRELLQVDPTTYGIEARLGAPRLTPQDFITRRKEAPIRRLAEQVATAVVSSGLGRPEEFQPVLGAWGAFFDAVAAVPPKGWRKWFHRAASEKQLRVLLADAEGRLAALEQTLDQRNDYMAQFEQKIRTPPTPPKP